jgi:hypothetical protein
MVGNHDKIIALKKVFPEVPVIGGFAQAIVELPGLRLFLLDTTEPGREGGAFCDDRCRWLQSELGRSGSDAVVLFMHHPPTALGVPWIDPGPMQSWTRKLAAAVEGRRIDSICAGHVHLGAVANWNGIPVITCPSTSSDTGLVFSGMKPAYPDARPLAERGGKGFALHRWSEGERVTFFGRCPDAVIAKWDDGTSDLVARMLAEQED